MASTPFLTDLARTVAESGKTVPTLRPSCAPARRSPAAGRTGARSVLGAKIVSAWGMTENGAVTSSSSTTTTSAPPPPTAARCRASRCGSSTSTVQALPAGQPGRLLVRACSNFGGYLKRPQWNGTDADGWFDTGDLASSTRRATSASRAAART
jgi:cyclohexanecarboxylate-CoA ligase